MEPQVNDSMDQPYGLEINTYLVEVDGVFSGLLNNVVETDNQSPNVTISSPSQSDNVGSPLLISGTATDASQIVQNRVQIRNTDTGDNWNGSAWVAAFAWVAPDGSNNWSYSLPLPAGANFSVRAFAWDSSSNRGDSATHNFTVN